MTIHAKINTRNENHYARWSRARRLLAEIKRITSAGGYVYFTTYTHSTRIGAKHVSADMFRATPSGLYMRRGKHWDCTIGCKVTYTMPA